MGQSNNGHPYQPEIIEYCSEAISSWCSFKNYGECSLKFRIDGISDEASFYRIKVFNGTNKITPGTPLQGSLEKAGDIQYYWFISTEANRNPGSDWRFDIGLGI